MRHQRGLTLVELVVSIVIISIAVISVLGALSAVASNSASAMVQEQGLAIAQAYLNEVLQKSFVDPDGGGVEASRDLYDDINDYAGLPPGAIVQNQNGVVIPEVGQFAVTVSVVAAPLGTVPAAQVRRVDVMVTHPSMQPVQLSGYRTQY
jgi:MSHA pilin protein MshD